MDEPFYPSNLEPMSQLAKKYLLQVEGHANKQRSYPLQLAVWGAENLELVGPYADLLLDWTLQALLWPDKSVNLLLFQSEDGKELRDWRLSRYKSPESLALEILGQVQDRLTSAKKMP